MRVVGLGGSMRPASTSLAAAQFVVAAAADAGAQQQYSMSARWTYRPIGQVMTQPPRPESSSRLLRMRTRWCEPARCTTGRSAARSKRS